MLMEALKLASSFPARPAHLHHALLLGVGGVDAVGLVHGHAASAGDIADDLVAGHGVAATGEAHQHAAFALDVDAVGGLAQMALRLLVGNLLHLGQRGGLGLALLLQQAADHIGAGDAAVAHRAVDVVELGKGVALENPLIVLRLGQRRERHAAALGLLFQHVAALDDVFAAQLALEELADLGLGLLGFDHAQPVGAGALGGGRGDDLHPVARLQLGFQRHDAPVDLRAHAVVAHAGVDAVGEVDGRGAALHAHDIAPWG